MSALLTVLPEDVRWLTLPILKFSTQSLECQLKIGNFEAFSGLVCAKMQTLITDNGGDEARMYFTFVVGAEISEAIRQLEASVHETGTVQEATVELDDRQLSFIWQRLQALNGPLQYAIRDGLQALAKVT